MRSRLLHEWVFERAALHPEAPAVATPSSRLTYGTLADRVRALAGHLADSGLRPGNRVLVALPNLPATVVASLAIQAMGCTAVEVNREWGADVLSELVAQSGVRQAIIWGRDSRVWGKTCASAPLERLWVVHGGPLPSPLLADLGETPASLLLDDGRVDPVLGVPGSPPVSGCDSDSPALILYTSGSTGQPRGVVQTFRNVDANTRSIVQYLGLGHEDRALLVLPLYYCYGRSVLQTHLFAGGSVYMDGRFAFPRVVLEALGNERCTGFAGVPLTFENHPPAGRCRDPLLPAPALRDPGWRRHVTGYDRLGSSGIPAGEAVRDVRSDGGHCTTQLPAARASRGEEGLDRRAHPGRATRGGR